MSLLLLFSGGAPVISPLWVQDDWVQLDWIYGGGVLSADPVYVLTIGGVTKTMLQGWEIRDPANGIGSMDFGVLSVTGAYVPTLDQEVIVSEDGVRIFGGQINSLREHGAGGHGITPIVTDVTAHDFNVLATRRYFTGETIPAGTLKAALTVLAGSYIQLVTLDPAQVDGPALPDLTYTGWKVSDILDQLSTFTGYVWKIDYNYLLRMYVPGTLTAPFTIAAGDGHVIGDVTAEPTRAKYANRVYVFGTGVVWMAEDAGEESVHGIWDFLVNAPDTTLAADAQFAAESILATRLPTAKTVQYDTYETGLSAGMTQGIVLAARHLNNTFLITEVVTRDMGRKDKRPKRSVTAIEGIVYQTGWREQIKEWGGGSGGVMTTPGFVGGGGTTFSRYAYFLGGSGLDFVQSPTPTWIASNPMLVQLNTVPRGTLTALVTARLRALEAGVSVQARLFDYTTGLACAGVSSVVTNTAWTTVSFTVTLTAGSDYYGLQLLPGSANADVGAISYIE